LLTPYSPTGDRHDKFVEITAQRSNQLSYDRISRCGRRGLNPQPLSSCSSDGIRADRDAPTGWQVWRDEGLLSQWGSWTL